MVRPLTDLEDDDRGLVERLCADCGAVQTAYTLELDADLVLV